MTAFDRHLERWVVHHRTAWLDPVFVWLTWAGSHGAVWLVLAAVLALHRRRWALLALVLAADVAADGLAEGLKLLVGRARPPLVYPSPRPLVHDPQSSAFPSGHAATSFACATVLACVYPRAAAGFYLGAAAIAYSRVYVGVHWPADVLAGAMLGVCVGLLVIVLYRRWWPSGRGDSGAATAPRPLAASRWRSSRTPPAG